MKLENNIVEMRYSLSTKISLIIAPIVCSSMSIYYFISGSLVFPIIGILMAIIIPLRNRKYFDNSIILTFNNIGIVYEEKVYPWSAITSARIKIIDGGDSDSADKNILIIVQDDILKEIRLDGLDKSPEEIASYITHFAKGAQLSVNNN